MSRAPFQVFVYLHRMSKENELEFALFRRSDAGYWQGIAGGGEDGESPIEAARREAFEEANIPTNSMFHRLDTNVCLPVIAFESYKDWDNNLFVIPQYYFAVEYCGPITISSEHTEVAWFAYAECEKRLHWDSDKTALWELNQRLLTGRMLD